MIPLRLRWGQLRSFCYRFRLLPYSERLFAGVDGLSVVSRPFAGRRLWVDVARSSTERLLFLAGERLVAERHLLAELARPGMRVADVGANLGYYALLLARRVGPAGRVDCFEPEPSNRALLEKSVQGLAQVRVHPIALGAGEATVALEPGINGLISERGSLPVPLRRLDDVLGPDVDPLKVDLLKIDVDGYEGQVLAGCREILEQARPAIFLELHPELIHAPFTVGGLVAELAALYAEVELWRPVRSGGLAKMLAARYGRRGVERLRDPEGFLAAVADGRDRDYFWAVCRARRAG